VLFVEERLRARQRLALAACGAVLVLGIGVQVVGASQYWDHFIRFSKNAQAYWLGVPNRSGALTPDHGGSCDPCFEDFYARNFTPAFSPIEGQWWFLKHHLAGDSWEVAAKDLPLGRYTQLPFLGARTWYENPPWDWWQLDFVGRFRAAGRWLFGLFLAGLLAGVILWVRGVRAARPLTAPCADTVPCSCWRPWPRLRAFLAPRLARLRDRLRGRDR
jgi:hypothetical protein